MRPPTGAPPPFPHPPQLSSSGPGRGGGTWSGAGRGSRPEWVRGARTPARSARRAQEVCGGAAGVGARGGVHVGREGVAESGRCPARPPPESPGGSEPGDRQARGGDPGAGPALGPAGAFLAAIPSRRRLRGEGSPSLWGGCTPAPGEGWPPVEAFRAVGRGGGFRGGSGSRGGSALRAQRRRPQVNAGGMGWPRWVRRLCLSLGQTSPRWVVQTGPGVFPDVRCRGKG